MQYQHVKSGGCLCIHEFFQYLQFSFMDLECLMARQSSYLRYSAQISLPAYSCKALSSPRITRHRLISLILFPLRQYSAPSFTTLVMEHSSICFSSSFSVDFQQRHLLSQEIQMNLLCGQIFLQECFIIRQPLRRLASTSFIDSDSELSSLLRLFGENEGLFLRRRQSSCTSPNARDSRSRILPTFQAVLEEAFSDCPFLLLGKSINCQNYDLQQEGLSPGGLPSMLTGLGASREIRMRCCLLLDCWIREKVSFNSFKDELVLASQYNLMKNVRLETVCRQSGRDEENTAYFEGKIDSLDSVPRRKDISSWESNESGWIVRSQQSIRMASAQANNI